MIALIMAGGSGTRFWPFSRHSRPKQMLSLVGEQSMLQMTVDRVKKVKQIKDVFIVTRADLAESIRDEIRGISPDNIIVEPSGKNTAPCIGLAALHISKRYPNEVMGIFPADHLIVGHKAFSKAVGTCNHLARKNESIVTIGIPPEFPSTAYGYIQYDQNSDEDHLDAYKLVTFAEKPPYEMAKKFIQSGDFLWNAGIFIWKTTTLLSKLKKYLPELNEALQRIDKRISKDQSFADIWKDISPVSIDYGLMEKVTDDTYVVQAGFTWNDLGSWNSAYNVSPKSKGKNVIRGGGTIIGGKNNYIRSNGHFTAVIGLDDIVVVHTDDATLVVKKDNVEEVKGLVSWLQENGREDLL